MATIDILDSGIIYPDATADRHGLNPAFPTLVKLDSDEIVAGYSVGGGPSATGDTQCSISRDGGKTWTWLSVVYDGRNEERPSTNTLRVSRAADGRMMAYGARAFQLSDEEGGHDGHMNEPVVCYSRDNAKTWSVPQLIESPVKGPFEISCPIVALKSGRLLAPAATWRKDTGLGESVVVFASEDGGKTWPETCTVFKDAQNRKGFWEQKVIELEPERLLAMAWTVGLDDYADYEDHFAFSHDGGRTFGAARPSGIRGQTCTPIWLGGDRLLCLYNRRYGHQGVVARLLRFTEEAFTMETEAVLWDAKTSRKRAPGADAHDEMHAFKFGLPSAIPLDNRELLAVHWCMEKEQFVIRWTRISVT